ncbi:MAG: hypothetical protein P8J87_15525, partial [Verrucomicrobiales bacterium]|nr:hypothetical protein [Verrucomicrobiales bacterium]
RGGEKHEKKGEKAESAEDVPAMKRGLLARLRVRRELEAYDALAAELVADNGEDLELRLEMMRRWDGEETGAEAVEYADAVLGLINEPELARYFGAKREAEGKEAKALKKKMEAERGALREALGVRVRALAGTDGDAAAKAMRQALVRLEKWEDEVGKAVREAVAVRDQRNGELLGLLRDELLQGGAERERFGKRIEILEERGWEHLVEREAAWLVRKFPEGELCW